MNLWKFQKTKASWEFFYRINLNPAFYVSLFNILGSGAFQVIIPHGEPVTVDSFLAWREKIEAELALERAK